MYTVCETESYT